MNTGQLGIASLDTFRLDVKYSQVASALKAAGIETVLLKGPAFDQLLFNGERRRAYADIDLLVEPGRVDQAERLLKQLGFDRAANKPLAAFSWRAGVAVGLLDPPHATPWIRDRDRFTIDLHRTLPVVDASAEEVWGVLAPHRVTITVVGSEVVTIDRVASALLIALHATHHGPSWTRARTDLERACEVLESDCWHAAERLARELRAANAMGIGLGTTPAGRGIAHELGLRTEPTFAYRLIWPAIARIDRHRASRRGL